MLMESHSREKHSSLCGKFVTYEENSVVNMAPETVFTTLHFLHNSRMGSLSYSVTLHKAGKPCQGQTL